MADPRNSAANSPAEVVRPLLRVRQFRQFTPEPVERSAVDAVADAARWSGSSANTQPWRFVVVRDSGTLRRLADAAQAGALKTATAAIAIALPDEPDNAVSHAYDEARAAERMLIAAHLLGFGAGVAWVRPGRIQEVYDIVGLPSGWFIRTIVALGHPTAEALRPKSAPGAGRRPRSEIVFEERWGAS